MASIFVVWDMSTPVIKINLERLPVYRPGGFDVVVPGLNNEGGSILHIVIRGIKKADRVLVLTDRPNANVGFEAGLALGLGKPILMAYRGRKMPKWTRVPPLQNYLQGNWYGIGQLEELITNEDAWFRTSPSPPLPVDGPCLDLCPGEGTGELLRRERDELELENWLRPDDLNRKLTLDNLNEAFKDTARLVWTITENEEDEDIRDGAINAANAIIAGWFYSRCYDQPDTPFWVLRLAGLRNIVDVELEESTFEWVEEYKKLITDKIERHWYSRIAKISQQDDSDGELVRIAVVPFENLSNHEHGEGFSMGLTDDLIGAIGNIERVKTIPRNSVMSIKRYELNNDAVADLLNAKYIVRGSLIQKGDYCLIEVSLYRSGIQNPMRSYRRRYLWDDVLNNSVVEQIVKEISNGINRGLAVDIKLPKRNNQAKELFWRANQALETYNNTRNPEYADLARDLFHQTIVKDGSYQEARIQIGFLDIIRWETIGHHQLLKNSLDIWQDILDRNNPNDPIALAETGYVNFILGADKANALAYVYQAVEHSPDHPIANNVLALLYLFLGYYEANLRLEDKVITSDPAYVYPIANAALSLQLMERYEDALQMAQKAIDIDPKAFVAILIKGAQYFYNGQLEKANETWTQGRKESSGEVRPVFDTLVSWVIAKKGNESTAALTLVRYRDDQWINGAYGPYFISLSALCGKEEEAIELLERTTTFAASYRFLIAEPTLQSLHKNPRFQKLLEKRYHEWQTNFKIFGDKLPAPPPELPDPASFLEQSGS